jgi:hypothetical protein
MANLDLHTETAIKNCQPTTQKSQAGFCTDVDLSVHSVKRRVKQINEQLSDP